MGQWGMEMLLSVKRDKTKREMYNHNKGLWNNQCCYRALEILIYEDRATRSTKRFDFPFRHIHVAFNNAIRLLLKMPTWCSASQLFVQHGAKYLFGCNSQTTVLVIAFGVLM